MEGSKIDYSNLVYKSGDKDYPDFAKFWPLSSFYLRLMNGRIGINVAKLNMKEFKYQINRIVKQKAKKLAHKNT